MRIAIDLTSLAGNFSGIEQYALRLSRALVRTQAQNQYTLLFSNEVFPGFDEMTVSDCCTTHVIHPKHASRLIASQVDLKRALSGIEADAYLFPAFPPPLTFRDKRSISVIHDVSFWDCPQTQTRKSVLYWRVMTRHATKNLPVITVSNFSKGRIHEVLGIPLEHIVVAYDGVDPCFVDACTDTQSFQRAQRRYNLPERYILSLCTLEPRKNLPFLVDSWVQARSMSNEVPELVLAGRVGWKTNALLETVPQSLLPHIHLTGFVEHEDLPSLYAHCTCFVCPSIYEGFGVPPLEALAAGARVLCSDIEVFHETCKDDAQFFSLDNHDELVEEILKVSWHDCTHEPRPHIVERFSWEACASSVLHALEGHQ